MYRSCLKARNVQIKQFLYCTVFPFTNVCAIMVVTIITSLFSKSPWPGDSEGILRSSSQAVIHLPTCLSHTDTRWRLYPIFLILTVKQGSCKHNFSSVWLDPTEIEPELTASVANALLHVTTDGFEILLIINYYEVFNLSDIIFFENLHYTMQYKKFFSSVKLLKTIFNTNLYYTSAYAVSAKIIL